jgi:hypothetical protein
MSEEIKKLYEKVLQKSPELWMAANAALLMREKGGKYPINSSDDFLRLANKGRYFSLGDQRIDIKQIRRYFPKKFYPIEDEDDLISKVLAASYWGSQAHEMEDRIRSAKKEMG